MRLRLRSETEYWRYKFYYYYCYYCYNGWLGSRVVSVLDAAATLSGNSLRQTVHTHRACVH